MSVQDPSVPLALPDRARPFRWGYYAVRTLLVAVLLAAAAMLPHDRGPDHGYDVGVVSYEKRDGLVLGYHSIAVREGAGEAPRNAGDIYDRREALAYARARAQEAFPDDPRGVQMADEIAEVFIEPNIVFD